jgi:hypothetical protein
MDAVRTPEDHFARLDGFPWTPTLLDDLPGFAGLRMKALRPMILPQGRHFVQEWGEPIARRALEILGAP